MSHKEEKPQLLIDVARLDDEGETFRGEVDIIDLNERFVKPFGGVRYELRAQLFGTELLVKGRVEQDFTLVCGRCLNEFDTTISVNDFETSLEVAENAEFVDLTNDVRESIILALPSYPVCDENCPGIAVQSEVPGDNRWDALDALKV